LIYTDIARTLRDARAYASSVSDLIMIDTITSMLADTLHEYGNFNAENFYKYTQHGYNTCPTEMSTHE